MFAKLIRGLKTMELEEKILHIGALITGLGVFLPWFEGKLFCPELCSGFGFFTGYIGLTVFLLQIFLIMIVVSPLLDGPIIVRKSSRKFAQLLLTGASFILLLSALSVLVQTFSEDSGATIRFGIYIALAGCIVSLLYAFLRYQEQQRQQVHSLFHHPEDITAETKRTKTQEEMQPPPPPAVPPPPPLEHHGSSFHHKQ